MLSLPKALRSALVFGAHRTMRVILLQTGQGTPSMFSFQGALVFQVARNWAFWPSFWKAWSTSVLQSPCIWQAVLLQTSACSLTSWCGSCLKKKHGKVVSPKVKLAEELRGAWHDKAPSSQLWTGRASEGLPPCSSCLWCDPLEWKLHKEQQLRPGRLCLGCRKLPVAVNALSSGAPAGSRPGRSIRICSYNSGVDWRSFFPPCFCPRTKYLTHTSQRSTQKAKIPWRTLKKGLGQGILLLHSVFWWMLIQF